MSVQAILFDLDGTLLDRDSSLLSFIHDQYERISALQTVERDVLVNRFLALDQHGYVWKDKVYQQLIEEFSLQDVGWATLLQDYLTYFPRHCVPFPNLLPTLTQIKAAGVKLGLISNGYGDFQFANLQALCIDHLFDEILISEWEELRKPDPAIFHRALKKLGVEADSALFVGDHPENDVRASHAVGMKAIWKRNELFDQEVEVEADACMDDLSEILRWLLPSPRQA